MSNRPLPPEERQARRRARQAGRAASTYHVFLKDLCAVGGMDEDMAERAAVAVLSALELRINGDEGLQLEAQLPRSLQKQLYTVERHAGAPPVKFGLDEFLEKVGEDLGQAPDEAEGIARSVFKVICRHVSAGEVDQILHQLPEELRRLWPDPALSRYRAEQAEEAARSRAHAPHRPAGPARHAEPGGEIRRLLGEALALPFEAQLGLLRALSAQVLRRLDPDTRLSYWRDLQEDVAEADRKAEEGEPLELH